MKKIIILLIAVGSSVSFSIPAKKVVSEEVKTINLNRLMIGYKID